MVTVWTLLLHQGGSARESDLNLFVLVNSGGPPVPPKI
jgi:hypothetical protein